MSNKIKELREKLRIAEKKLERNWSEEKHQEFLRLTSELARLEESKNEISK